MKETKTNKFLRADKIPEIFIVGSIDYGRDFALSSECEGLTCELSILCDQDASKQNALKDSDNSRETKFKSQTAKIINSLEQGRDRRSKPSLADSDDDFCVLQFFDSQDNFARYSR